MSQLDKKLIEQIAQDLPQRDKGFLQRVFGDGLGKYAERLEAVKILGADRVLDVGCGFGQWAMAMGPHSQEVFGVDISKDRIQAAVSISKRLDLKNVFFDTGPIDNLDFLDGYFDAVFSYSAVYYTDVKRTMNELIRVLKPGGRIYICSNAIGWYIYNIIKRPNPSPDFSPLAYGVRSLVDSFRYHLFKVPPSTGGSIATSGKYLEGLMLANGIEEINWGPEGTVSLSFVTPTRKSFFPGHYLMFDCCLEWTGVKAS
jgi:ubiquinone/menaquinone biosynthesis C-methylase UbiE